MATAVLALRTVLAAVFLTAGVGKLLDLEGSRRAVHDFGVPEGSARFIGAALPAVELVAGLGLIFRPTARWSAALALALLVGFIAVIARAISRGEQPDCHCFGQIHSAPATGSTLVRNALLAVFSVTIVAYGSGPALDTWVSARSGAVLVAIGVGIVALAVSWYAWTERSLNRQLKRDLEFARRDAAMRRGVALGWEAPDFTLADIDGETVTLGSLLDRGKPVLFMFMSPWCGPCEKLLPRVAQWQRTLSERLSMVVLSMGTPEQNQVFSDHGLDDVLLQTDFEVAGLYGVTATPSAILVSSDGKVSSTVGETEYGIEPLLRLALRDHVDASREESAAV